jgi:hypothetical protein
MSNSPSDPLDLLVQGDVLIYCRSTDIVGNTLTVPTDVMSNFDQQFHPTNLGSSNGTDTLGSSGSFSPTETTNTPLQHYSYSTPIRPTAVPQQPSAPSPFGLVGTGAIITPSIAPHNDIFKQLNVVNQCILLEGNNMNLDQMPLLQLHLMQSRAVLRCLLGDGPFDNSE